MYKTSNSSPWRFSKSRVLPERIFFDTEDPPEYPEPIPQEEPPILPGIDVDVDEFPSDDDEE
jgi:hypothetical protein